MEIMSNYSLKTTYHLKETWNSKINECQSLGRIMRTRNYFRKT